VSLEVLFEERAINQTARFLADDPEGVRELFRAIDDLVVEPRPPRRFRSGRRTCVGSRWVGTACCTRSEET
jgi:hypothetical protein